MEAAKTSVVNFLRSSTCFDAIPSSWRVITFDEGTTLRHVYKTLVEYDTYSRGSYLRNECSRGNVSAGVVIGSDGMRIIGIITSSDFAQILRFASRTGSVDDILNYHTIRSWWEIIDSAGVSMDGDTIGSEAARMISEDQSYNPEFKTINSVNLQGLDYCLSPDVSLFDACKALQMFKAKALPIWDSAEGICIGVISHMIVLRYIWGNFSEERPLFEDSLIDLSIGKYISKGDRVMSIPISSTLQKAVEENADTLAVVDDFQKPVAVFCKGKFII